MSNFQPDSSHLPSLDSHYQVSSGEVEQYVDTGHVLLRQVCTPDEIAAYRPAIAAAAEKFNVEHRPIEERDTYGKAFLQIMNLWIRDENVRRFTLAQRFAGIASQLMGVQQIRIYHDQALFKEPGGGPTPWHQDQYYWPLDTVNTVTMWMPLVDLATHIGSMTFASRSNRYGYLGELPISDESERLFSELIADKGLSLHHYGAMSAGDATFHSGWTLHSAPGNPTPDMREVMTVIYFADGAHATIPDNRHREDDLERWMPGVEPGELAASDLNPLV